MDGKTYCNKSDYLLAAGNDKEIMHYIKPKSELGLEIKHQQEAQKQVLQQQGEKEKDDGFEL